MIEDLRTKNQSLRAITWTPKVCKIMAFMIVIMGLGLLFYILLGFRYCFFRVYSSANSKVPNYPAIAILRP